MNNHFYDESIRKSKLSWESLNSENKQGAPSSRTSNVAGDSTVIQRELKWLVSAEKNICISDNFYANPNNDQHYFKTLKGFWKW